MTINQQASAVEAAQRILVGAVKKPTPNSAEGKYLAAQLEEAARTLRSVANG